MIEIHSHSAQQTRELGRVLGETLRGGEVVELCGSLGTGKTVFAKGLALGLGVPDDEVVVSPTFVLVREYAGRLRFYHCDAYRLQTVAELFALGLEEMLEDPNSVVAIEWADRFPRVVAADTFRVELEYESDSARRVRIAAASEAQTAELARRLEESGCLADGARPWRQMNTP